MYFRKEIFSFQRLVEAEYRQSDTRGEASGCFASIRKMLCVACSSIILIDPRRRLVRLVVELPEEFDAARHRDINMGKTRTTATYGCFFIRTMMKAFVVEKQIYYAATCGTHYIIGWKLKDERGGFVFCSVLFLFCFCLSLESESRVRVWLKRKIFLLRRLATTRNSQLLTN